MLGIAAIYFLWVTSTNIYPVSWAFFARAQNGWDSKLVGLSLTFVGMSMAIVQIFLIGRMVRRFGERNTGMVGLIAGIVGVLLFAFIPNGTLALALCLCIGIQGMAMPSINAMMSRRTPAGMQGELQGFNGSLAALAALFAPLIYNTSLSYYTGQHAPIYFAGAPFIISAVMASTALIALYRLKPSEHTY